MKSIGLIRGINVGGKNKIKMAELKDKLTAANYDHVSTYIQSGNVIFDSSSKPSMSIEEVIKKNWDIDVYVVYKTHKEFVSIQEAVPFENKNERAKNIYISFLAETPSNEKIDELKHLDNFSKEIFLFQDTIFTYYPEGFSNSKRVVNYEKLLEVVATTRNFNTLNKLVSLSTDHA